MHLEGDPGSRPLRAVPLVPVGPETDPQPWADPTADLQQGAYLVTAYRPDGAVDHYQADDAGYAAQLATDLAAQLGPAGIRVQRVAAEVEFTLVPHWEVHVTGGRALGVW